MTRPTAYLPTSGTLTGADLVAQINDWLEALRTDWVGTSAPGIATEGQTWLDTTGGGFVMKQYRAGAWVTLQQTNLTDATAGRFLLAGAFGLGGNSIIENTSWDGIAVTGVYHSTVTTTTGLPAAQTPWSMLHINQSSTNAYQVAVRGGGDNMAFRRKNAGAWAPWQIVYSRGSIVGTVSESGGVPTGAVVQRGSNADGEFTRFADGTQVCSKIALIGSATISNAFMGGFRSNLLTWTFPAAFAAAAEPVITATPLQLSASGVVVDNWGLTSVTYAYTAPASQSAALRNVALTAIGRWF